MDAATDNASTGYAADSAAMASHSEKLGIGASHKKKATTPKGPKRREMFDTPGAALRNGSAYVTLEELRAQLKSVSGNSIRRLARRAGAKRLSADIKAAVKELELHWILTLAKSTGTLAEYQKRRTISGKMTNFALDAMGCQIVGDFDVLDRKKITPLQRQALEKKKRERSAKRAAIQNSALLRENDSDGDDDEEEEEDDDDDDEDEEEYEDAAADSDVSDDDMDDDDDDDDDDNNDNEEEEAPAPPPKKRKKPEAPAAAVKKKSQKKSNPAPKPKRARKEEPVVSSGSDDGDSGSDE